MIDYENDDLPTSFDFDIAIVAVGYESRCRWIVAKHAINASKFVGLEFGFLQQGAYEENRNFYRTKNCEFVGNLGANMQLDLTHIDRSGEKGPLRVFVDISSMSREMIANVVLALESLRAATALSITAAYSPSEFGGKYSLAPIRLAAPIKPVLAGWSAQPEKPLGTIFGLGCEPGLALGALQVLEPAKAWAFSPIGIDEKFDKAVMEANEHIGDIFDVSRFEYMLTQPKLARSKFEALLNALHPNFRLIAVPFGPKIFAWTTLATIVFTDRLDVGVWTFSSKENAQPVDRKGTGDIVWHSISLTRRDICHV